MHFGYYGSELIAAKNSFAPCGSVANHLTPAQQAAHLAAEHKHKADPEKAD
jgi:hypothetical protein